MMQRVYSVFDRKAVAFGSLMFFSNDEIAKRGCGDLMRTNDMSVPMVQYPEDFDLYCVGSFDNASGVLAPLGPEIVCRFSDFVKKGE